QIVCANCSTEITQMFSWIQKLINDAKDLGLSGNRNDWLNKTYDAANGARDMAAFAGMSIPGVQSPLPPQADQILAAIRGGGGPATVAAQLTAAASGLTVMRDMNGRLYDAQAQGLANLNRSRSGLASARDQGERDAAGNQLMLTASEGVRQSTQGAQLFAMAQTQQRISDHNTEAMTRRDICQTINSLRQNEGPNPPPKEDCSQFPLVDVASSASMTSYSEAGVTPVAFRPTASGSNPMDTMLAQDWGQQAADNASALGVNPEALAATCVVESGCRPVPGQGTIAGAWQMTRGTENAAMQQALARNPELASQANGGPMDPGSQSIAASQELYNNAKQLQNAGIANPTVIDARGAYQFGAQFGVQIARADPDTQMGSILPQSSLGPNRISPSMTVGQ